MNKTLPNGDPLFELVGLVKDHVKPMSGSCSDSVHGFDAHRYADSYLDNIADLLGEVVTHLYEKGLIDGDFLTDNSIVLMPFKG